MKKALSLALCLALLLCLCPVTASAEENGTCGDGVRYTWYEGYGSPTGSLYIYGDGPMVTYGGGSPFYRIRSELAKVRIYDGVTAISYDAFAGCYQLKEVYIPASVRSIASGAFSSCTNLTNVYITDLAVWCQMNIVSNPLAYAKNLYVNYTLVTDLVIPSSVTAVGNNAFIGYDGVRSVVVPSNVTAIGDSAFEGCTTLADVTMENGVSVIGSEAFRGCTALEEVTVPSSVATIGDYAFSYDRSLERVKLNDGLTSIGAYAFSGCSGLSSITLPSSVTQIGAGAFSGCGTEIIWNEELCEEELVTTGLSTINIPNGVLHIEKDTFRDCAGFTSMTIPDSVETIEASAFDGCRGLRKLTIGAGVGSIGQSAFSGCEGLTTVTVPDSVETIGASAFRDCSGLTAVTLGSNVTAIGKDAFLGCSELTDVYCRIAPNQMWRISIQEGNECLQNAAWHYLPVVTQSPKDETVYAGQTATFSAAAEDAAAYRWQYQKSGETKWINVSANGTSPTYTLTTAVRHNGYTYRCQITNATGSVYTGTATLTLKTVKPTVTLQPRSAVVNEGKKAVFSVDAEGAASYRWQYKKPGAAEWINVANNGASPTYTLTTAARHNGYSYRCQVTNAVGSVYSDTVRLTVIAATAKPTVTTQPQAATVAAGDYACFRVYADNANEYQWQYQKPGETAWRNVINNGTSATLTVTTAARHNGYVYRCRVSNPKGSAYSAGAKLTVIVRLAVTTEPDDCMTSAGQKATFALKVTGSDPVYQWQYQKPGSSVWIDVSVNGKSSVYTLTTASRHNGYSYRCRISNGVGTIYTRSVVLTVLG